MFVLKISGIQTVLYILLSSLLESEREKNDFNINVKRPFIRSKRGRERDTQ